MLHNEIDTSKELKEELIDCHDELLYYKYDEVIDYYANNFGSSVADKLDEKMSLKLDENNPKFPELFERTILRLWFGLNYRIIDRINVGLKNKGIPKKIDFSDIVVELENMKEKTELNKDDFEELKAIYFDDIEPIIFRIKSRIIAAKYDEKEKKKYFVYGILISALLSTILFCLDLIF